MAMPSSIDLLSPMTQEASGTAWLPVSTPMFGKMWMYPNGDMLMLHGAVMPRYVDAGSKRGDRRVDSPNWAMGMYSHPLDAASQLGVRVMASLDPLTEGGWGYPLLFQTGETWHHQPLHDRQHPHDLFSELSVDYSRQLRPNLSSYLYLGYPGEPALGPPTYMHRLIAYDLPDAPIGHHWQDATHITFGVATAGLNVGNRVKLEGSVFTGREPNENRYDFDTPRFDSRSARLSFNPRPDHAFQVSYGFVRNPEGDGSDVRRTTASWIYNRSLGDDANFTTSLVWGRNDVTGGEGATDSYLGEADLQQGRHTFYTRLENIQKSGHELVLPEAYHEGKYRLNALTVGYNYDLSHGKGIDTAVGAAITVDKAPSALDPIYGRGTPVGFQLMFRLRPSRMKMAHGHKARMDMSGAPAAAPKPPVSPAAPAAPVAPAPPAAPAPAAPVAPATPTPTPPAPTSPAVGSVTAVAAPEPPKARQKTAITVTVFGTDGKPLTGATVDAVVTMIDMDMGTLRPALKELGEGKYGGTVTFSMPGSWQLTVRATPPGGGKTLSRSFVFHVSR